MSTVDSKEIIRKLLRNKGMYPGDPQCHSIWSYRTIEGNKTQAVFYYGHQVDLDQSPYVTEPELLWSQEKGLTFAGKLWLQENK